MKLLLLLLILPVIGFSQNNDDQQFRNTNVLNLPQQAPVQQDRNPSEPSGGTASPNQNKPCNDCDEVKRAMRNARVAGSGGSVQRNKMSIKRWIRKTNAKLQYRLRQSFANRKAGKSNFSVCFNWS